MKKRSANAFIALVFAVIFFLGAAVIFISFSSRDTNITGKAVAPGESALATWNDNSAHPAWHAIDNNLSTYYTACTTPNAKYNSGVLRYDLGSIKEFNRISIDFVSANERIFNKSTYPAAPACNYAVWISNGTSSRKVYERVANCSIGSKDAASPDLYFTLQQAEKARFVTIQYSAVLDKSGWCLGVKEIDAINEPPMNINIYADQNISWFKGVGWNIDALGISIPPNVQFLRVFGWYVEDYKPSRYNNTYESARIRQLYSLLNRSQRSNTLIYLSAGNIRNYYNPPNCSKISQKIAFDANACWPDRGFWLSEVSNIDPNNNKNKFCHNWYSGDTPLSENCPIKDTCDPAKTNTKDPLYCVPGCCSETQKAEWRNIGGVETDHPYSDSLFAEVLTHHLNYIVNNKGFRVNFVSLWNEPHGDWAYHPRNTTKKYPLSFRNLYKEFKLKRDAWVSLRGSAKLAAFEGEYNATEFTAIKDYVDVITLHDYTENSLQDTIRSIRSVTNKPIIIGEIGDFNSPSTCGEEADGTPWSNLSWERKREKIIRHSVITTNKMLLDINAGAYAVARWIYNSDLPVQECFRAARFDGGSFNVFTYTHSSLKILSDSLMYSGNNLNYDFRILNTTSSRKDNLTLTAINIADPQQSNKLKLVIWIVNPDKIYKNLNITAHFSGEVQDLKLSYLREDGVIAYDEVGPFYPRIYSFIPGQPVSLFVPGESIIVLRS